MTLGIAAAPLLGSHDGVGGTVQGGGVPLPLIDLDASSGAVEFHGEWLPYVQTRHFGNPENLARAQIESADATLRIYEPNRRIAFGVGYGALFDTTHLTAPPGYTSQSASGARLELHGRFPTSAASRLELTFGGMPLMHGTLQTATGIAGAAILADLESGTQIDATAREVVATQSRLSFNYGVRYINQTIFFEHTSAVVERNAGVLPFVELRVRL